MYRKLDTSRSYKASNISGMGLRMEVSVMEEVDDVNRQILGAVEWI